MGYDTDFKGAFDVSPAPLAPEHANYLRQFNEVRHQTWIEAAILDASDPAREAALLPIGQGGAYFTGEFDNEYKSPRVLDHNRPPEGVPELYCQWVPTPSGEQIVWDGNEKFYEYIPWIEYLIEHFLGPWGYRLNGTVNWRDEEGGTGTITIIDNVVSVT